MMASTTTRMGKWELSLEALALKPQWGELFPMKRPTRRYTGLWRRAAAFVSPLLPNNQLKRFCLWQRKDMDCYEEIHRGHFGCNRRRGTGDEEASEERNFPVGG